MLSFGMHVAICCVVCSTLDQKHHIGNPIKVKGFLFFWLSLASIQWKQFYEPLMQDPNPENHLSIPT